MQEVQRPARTETGTPNSHFVGGSAVDRPLIYNWKTDCPESCAHQKTQQLLIKEKLDTN